MSLRSKFIMLIGLVVVVSYGITFYRTSQFQNELVLTQAAQQGRLLHRQVLLTRKWVADHNGLFLLRQPGVEPNPFLQDPEIVGADGRRYVKRNPAMVTRELSEYTGKEGFGRYRVTTLKPINQANAPDHWERRSLLRIENGAPEVIEITGVAGSRTLRYIAPLHVEASCLPCHARQGYRVGDIRGGLSVSIPVDQAFASIARNNRMLLAIGLATIFVVGVVLYLMVDLLVVRRLNALAGAMDGYPGSPVPPPAHSGGSDEVGRLAGKFAEFCTRLEASQGELDRTRKQYFQSEKQAALGRLAAGVAHEVNNPLGGMLNCVKGMRETPEDPGLQQRYLDLIEKGLRRIGDTVRLLLNFGRSEPLRLRMLSVDDQIREAFFLLGYALEKIDLRLELGLSRLYALDASALQQVVVNISLNAIQAMPDGGMLTVSTREENGHLLLSFADTGVGIAGDNLSRIFDPFYTSKDVGQGSGLGLAVTSALVQRMQGRISVQSSPGQGSCFIVELPVHDLEEGKQP